MISRSASGARQRFSSPGPVLLLLLNIACLVFVSFNAGAGFEPDLLLLLAASVIFVTVGLVIVHRSDGTRVGWVIAAVGTSLLLAAAAAVLADEGSAVATAVGGAVWFSWFVLIGLLMYWFPTGKPLSPRWRWVGWLGFLIALTAVSYVVSEQLCLEDRDGTCVQWVDNPIGIPGMPNPEYGAYSGIGYIALLVFIVAAAGTLVVRFVRSRGVERLQLKWLAFAVVGVVGATVAQETVAKISPVTTVVFDVLWGLSIVAVPVAIGVALLKYRLYEIDRIVSRTVTYLIVVGLLSVVYLGGFLLVTQMLPEQSDIGVAVATLAVAALFNPVRTRIRRYIERRFNRARYDTERVMDRFSASLQGTVDSGDVLDGWMGVVSETMQPATLSVWVRS